MTNALPILIGFVPPIRGAVQQALLILLAGFYSAAFVYFLFRHRQGLWSLITLRRARTFGSELLVLVLITNVSLTLFTDFSRWLPDHCQRYLLPTYTVLPIVLFTFLNDWKGRFGRWALVGGSAFLLGFQVWGNFVQDTWLILRPEKYQGYRERLAREHELLGFLKRNGYDRIYTEEGICRKAMLLERGNLVCSDPYQEVYPNYADQVDSTTKVAFVFYGEHPLFEKTLDGAGGGHRKKKINNLYTLYGDFTPPPPAAWHPRTGWSVEGRPEPGEPAELLDGDMDSGWSGPQVPDAGLLIDMGRVHPVSRLCFIPQNSRELAAGFQLEASEDGRQWKSVSKVSDYWGPFFWSGPHPMIKIRRGRVELSFPEIKARYLNLTVTPGGRRRSWSVAEIFVGKALQEKERETPPQNPSDLLRFLEANKIRTVYADHWLSAVLRVESGRRLRTMASNLYLGNNGEKDPLPDQRAPVSFDAGTAFVLERGGGALFTGLTRPGGITCAQRTFGAYEIYYHCGKKEGPVLDPAEWKVSASVNREEADRAVDGVRGTRWSSNEPQHPGLFFEVDLGKLSSVRGLVFSLGDSRRDFPRRLKVLGSRDGKIWSEIETDWTSDFYWAGNVLLRMRGEKITYLFDPVEVRFLKLVQEGSDPRYYWSIHELTVYG